MSTDISILLAWGTPKRVTTRFGERIVRTAPATDAFRRIWKLNKEALKAQPKPTPAPLLPVDIFAPYHAPSLLDSIPRRDYKPIYVRPELVPTPTPEPTPQPKSRPTPNPPPETFYVSQ
jgi:hypothetical protein